VSGWLVDPERDSITRHRYRSGCVGETRRIEAFSHVWTLRAPGGMLVTQGTTSGRGRAERDCDAAHAVALREAKARWIATQGGAL